MAVLYSFFRSKTIGSKERPVTTISDVAMYDPERVGSSIYDENILKFFGDRDRHHTDIDGFKDDVDAVDSVSFGEQVVKELRNKGSRVLGDNPLVDPAGIEPNIVINIPPFKYTRPTIIPPGQLGNVKLDEHTIEPRVETLHNQGRIPLGASVILIEYKQPTKTGGKDKEIGLRIWPDSYLTQGLDNKTVHYDGDHGTFAMGDTGTRGTFIDRIGITGKFGKYPAWLYKLSIDTPTENSDPITQSVTQPRISGAVFQMIKNHFWRT